MNSDGAQRIRHVALHITPQTNDLCISIRTSIPQLDGGAFLLIVVRAGILLDSASHANIFLPKGMAGWGELNLGLNRD